MRVSPHSDGESYDKAQNHAHSGVCVTIDAKLMGYARETALCVDLAYVAMEQDLLEEIARADDRGGDGLSRVLGRLRDRRAALTEFASIASKRGCEQ